MNLGETGELGQARQRIAELEESLARYQQRLKTAQSKHLGWQRSEIAQIVHTLVRLHDRLLPGGSWRRGGAKLVIRSGRYLYRRVVRWLRPRPGQAGNYTRWLRGHDAGPAELLRQRQTPLPHAPRFCLLADVCGLPLAEGKRTVRSLLRQTHSDWELRLAVPAGQGVATRAWLDKIGR
ncbi:MAG: hypothetical protein JO112_12280, partial [Planctomycetes bacterium]|nr:hypothetical protein [Planctomycetota bacterium]